MKKNNNILYLGIVFIFLGGFFLYYLGITNDVNRSTEILYVVNKILSSLYYTTSMFFFNNNFSNIAEKFRQNQIYYFCFWFVHILAVLSTITTVLFLFHRVVRNYFKLLRAYWVKRYIIWGINDESITFIKNLLIENKGEQFEIIVVIDENKNIILEKIENVNVAYVCTSIDDIKLNKKLYLSTYFNKITYILIFGNNYIDNINKAYEIGKVCKKDKVNEWLHIVIESDFDDWINYYVEDINCNLKTFSKAELVSREFLINYPPHSFIKVNHNEAKAISDYNILIIGFGKTGEQLLLKILSHAQYENSKFKAIVIDSDMHKLKGQFQRNYEGLCKNYNVEFLEIDVGSEEFNSLMEKLLDKINTIICCMKEDEKNIKTGIELSKKLININNLEAKVLIRSFKKNEFIKKIHNDIIINNTIYFFGSLEDIFTYKVIIEEELDKLAEGINNYYNINNTKFACDWSKLDNFLKDANRHPAQHIFAKLHLVGLKTCKAQQIPKNVHIIHNKKELLDYLGEKRLMSLSRFEHLRWNAFYYSKGWDSRELDDCIEVKDKFRKLHACIVPWNKLEEVSNKFNDDYKLKDIQQVENTIDYLMSIGYIVYSD